MLRWVVIPSLMLPIALVPACEGGGGSSGFDLDGGADSTPGTGDGAVVTPPAPPIADASSPDVAENIVDSGMDAAVDAAQPDAAPPPLGPVQFTCSPTAQYPTQDVVPTSYNHKAAGTPITYSTEPPSGGDHYPVWANFHEYQQVVPDGYLVHSMEHGAVVIFYRCDANNDCTRLLPLLRAVRDAIPDDPLCTTTTGGCATCRVRVILVPRPTLDVHVAAAAWGHTWKTTCAGTEAMDRLKTFITTHYAKTEENFCAPGTETF